MTSTNFNIGFGGESRNSSKVLKPPGGGSSDIFGAANGGSTPSTPRSKNHMASNIFAAPQNRNGDSARKVSVDSHNRLFGEADRAQAVNKNQGNKSSLPFGSANTNNGGGDVSDSSAGSQVHTNGKSTNNGNGVSSIVHANGNGHAKTNGEVYLNGNGTKHELDALSPRSQHGSPITSPRNGVLHIMQMDVRHRDPPASMNKIDSFIDNHDAPLTNNSNTTSLSSTTGTSSSSGMNDNGNLRSPRWMPRNPITGFGIDASPRRRRKMDVNYRDGNPVTGEGYRGGHDTNHHSAPLSNGNKPLINKNRVPPGGFSSGLW